MDEGRQGGHVSERFARLLALYRRPDGSEWGGQGLEDATGRVVTRSYISNLKNGRIENPGLAKLEAIARAMGFPPRLWFGDGEDHAPDAALVAALEDETAREILAGGPETEAEGRAAPARHSTPDRLSDRYVGFQTTTRTNLETVRRGAYNRAKYRDKEHGAGIEFRPVLRSLWRD